MAILSYNEIVSVVDENGNVIGGATPLNTTGAPAHTIYSTTAVGGLENSAVVKASPGTLAGFSGNNQSTAKNLYIMVFDAAALPANGAIPRIMVPAPFATSSKGGSILPGIFSFEAATGSDTFAVGIVIAASTTPATLTVDTTNKTFFSVEFN